MDGDGVVVGFYKGITRQESRAQAHHELLNHILTC